MKKLSEMPDDSVFYRGTIVTIKGVQITPGGIFDQKYAMISNSNPMSKTFSMLDLYKSIGSSIIQDMKPNLLNVNKFASDKQGIFDWVKEHFELFFTEEGKKFWIPQIPEIVYVDHFDDYFVQTNRDIFIE